MPADSLRLGLCTLLSGCLLLAPMPPARAEQAPPAAARPAEPGYVLRYGDALNVWVLGEEALKLEKQPIRPDGRLSVPLLGEVEAGGKTIPQLSEALTRGYRRYVRDPRLVVNVATFRPLKISLLGLVNKPGTYEVAEPPDLLAGLALAGGLDRTRADLSAVELRRADGSLRVIDLHELLAGREPNPALGDGDTVIVRELPGPDWDRILPQVATALSILGSIAMISWNFRN